MTTLYVIRYDFVDIDINTDAVPVSTGALKMKLDIHDVYLSLYTICLFMDIDITLFSVNMSFVLYE